MFLMEFDYGFFVLVLFFRTRVRFRCRLIFALFRFDLDFDVLRFRFRVGLSISISDVLSLRFNRFRFRYRTIFFRLVRMGPAEYKKPERFHGEKHASFSHVRSRRWQTLYAWAQAPCARRIYALTLFRSNTHADLCRACPATFVWNLKDKNGTSTRIAISSLTGSRI